MRRTQLFVWVLLVILAGATAAGYLITARVQPAPVSAQGRQPAVMHTVGVNRRVYDTATQLVLLTDTDVEQHLALAAEHLADQLLDQALANAIQTARLNAQSTGNGGQALLARLQQTLRTMARRKAQEAQLQAQLQSAPPAQRQRISEQIAMVEARMEFDQAQVADARADAMRSDSTDLGLLQQIEQEHQENHSPQAARALPSGVYVPVRGLADALQALWRSHQKLDALGSAEAELQAQIQQTRQQHAAIEGRIEQENHANRQMSQAIPGLLAARQRSARQQGQAMAAQTIGLMHRLAAEQKTLSGFDQQIQTERQIANIYTRWQAIVERQRQQELHLLFREVLLLLGLLASLFLLDQLSERFFDHLPREQKRLSTLRRLTRLGFIIVGATGTLMISFGRPSQIATLMGLTGAGLMVAFQDALLSIAGWFVLMGRNGIVTGDWVEINGVSGEVVEVGLLRTALLETGNWTEPGHPTGRKVFCPNSLVFRSPYFNFTTARQWLWDELQLPMPADLDPRRLSSHLQAVAQRELGEDAEAAALDHQSLRRLRILHSIPTAPVVQLRPGPSGMQICIRYITTAQRRTEVRERLYQAILVALDSERTAVSR